MLRRIDVNAPWRSLDTGFWSDELPLGCRTIVYGHNGSGKSTLSELLLSPAESDCVTDVVWGGDENKHRSNIKAGGACPSVSMAVFTRKWVETNLSAFLDGANASAIVTLGKEAIEAKEEERLTEEIDKLHIEATEADTQQNAASSKIDKLARDLQNRIVSELKEFDYNYFTKNRFSVTRVSRTTCTSTKATFRTTTHTPKHSNVWAKVRHHHYLQLYRHLMRRPTG